METKLVDDEINYQKKTVLKHLEVAVWLVFYCLFIQQRWEASEEFTDPLVCCNVVTSNDT